MEEIVSTLLVATFADAPVAGLVITVKLVRYMSRDMCIPTISHFDMCRVR